MGFHKWRPWNVWVFLPPPPLSTKFMSVLQFWVSFDPPPVRWGVEDVIYVSHKTSCVAIIVFSNLGLITVSFISSFIQRLISSIKSEFGHFEVRSSIRLPRADHRLGRCAREGRPEKRNLEKKGIRRCDKCEFWLRSLHSPFDLAASKIGSHRGFFSLLFRVDKGVRLAQSSSNRARERQPLCLAERCWRTSSSYGCDISVS